VQYGSSYDSGYDAGLGLWSLVWLAESKGRWYTGKVGGDLGSWMIDVSEL